MTLGGEFPGRKRLELALDQTVSVAGRRCLAVSPA
jgi:hypothetical protein